MSNKKHWNCGKKLVGSPFILLNRILLKVFQSSYILNNLSSNWVKFYFLICFNIISCNYFLKCIYLPLESFKALVFLKYKGWVKKSVISGSWCKVLFFCANLLYGVFSIFFGNFIFCPKISPRTFETCRYRLNLQGESKKSVISVAWCKVVLFCANLLYGVFSIFFGNF